MTSTWIIADTHFGSQPRSRLKATGLTGAEIDERIVGAWRKLVGQADEVWHLGDVGDLSVIKSLSGTKRLILGNDDGKGACLASGIFSEVHIRHTVHGIHLVHRPRDATEIRAVFHGHLHALSDPRPEFICLSVDQTNFVPIEWSEALKRLKSDYQNTKLP